MRKFRLFLAVVVLATLSSLNVHARAVGDTFAGRIPGTTNADRCFYRIITAEGSDLTVSLYETSLPEVSGAVTLPATTADSTGTVFRVTAVNLYNSTRKNAFTSITLSEGIESLGPNTLAGFPNLTTINLPASLNHCQGAIYSNTKLTTITVASGNPYFKVSASDGCLYSKDGTILVAYPQGRTSVTSFSIPEGVTTIGQNSLITSTLQTITIPSTCTNIHSMSSIASPVLSAYNVAGANPVYSSLNGWLCSKDKSVLWKVPGSTSGTVALPSQIKVVKSYSFQDARNVTHILLTNVDSVYSNFFYGNGSRIQEITIYPSLKYYEPIYYGVANFQRFNFSGTNDYYTVDDRGVLYTKDYTRLVQAPRSVTGGYVTHANTKTIGSSAFAYSPNVTSITLTSNVETIESQAFGNCQNLSSVTFNQALKMIGGYSFWGCTSLGPIVTIPASVDTIGYAAFASCTSLQEARLMAGSQLSYLGLQAFDGCSALTTFRFLGSHVAPSLHIGERAFANCSKLASANGGTFNIPKAVNHIGESAFNGCSSLKQAAFHPESALDTIGFAAFQNCGLTSIDIPKTVKYIGNEAFNSCQQLKTVKIPAITNYVGPQAFLFCGQLREILVDEANTNYSSVDGMLASKDKKTLLSFPAGKAATYYTMLSPSFETINDSAFYYNRQLRSVTLPKKVTRIGAHAFALCDKLERINFLADSPISDVHAEAFVDMEKKSLLKNINLYVRNGHKTAFESSSFWGTGKSKSINEAFLVMDDNGSVEYFPMSSTDASIVDVQSDVKTFVVPEKVPGQPAYSVKLIGDYAFENSATSIDEVVVPSGVQLNYVGANAFVKTTNSTLFPPIKNVFMVNGTPAELATDKFGIGAAYNEIPNDAHIYVKKSALADYQTAWSTMADRIDYKIPGISISKTYGTFAREFDVDLSDYSQDAANNGKGKVWAFVAGDGVLKEGTGSGSGAGEYYIRMHSINEGQKGDGTYIPAGTGVLLKAADGTPATPANYHYVIGEKDVNAAVSGSDVLMKGVTVNDKYLSDTNRNLYAMQGGLFRPFAGATNVKIPVHKAYLELPVRAAGAKVMFYFDNPSAIEALGSEEGGAKSEDAPVYDLQGRRVSGNAALKAGIYVKNGKKFVIK